MTREMAGPNGRFLFERFFPKGMVAISEALWPLHALGLPSVWKLITSERSERRRQKQGCLVLGLRESLLCILLFNKSPRPARFEGEGNGLHLSGGGGVAHIYGEERGRLWRLSTASHQSLHCLDTKMDSLTNDLSFTSYQIRSFAKERPCPHCSYREEGTSPSLVSEILLLIMNPSNFEGETWGVNSECYKQSMSNSQLQHRTGAKEGRDFT